MGKLRHIFISYRSHEADFALQLASSLKNMGAGIWMDRLDSGIRTGDDWVQTLQDAIDNCVALIAVLSPDYVQSKYCRRELKRADTLGRPIYPILLQDIGRKNWPFEIQEKQYIDFREWRDLSFYRKQISQLVKVLRQQNPDQFGVTPDLETQYLTKLIADLESHKGVLEYVDLSGQTEATGETRPEPHRETGWSPEFALLVDFQPTKEPTDWENEKQVPLQSIHKVIQSKQRFLLLGDPGSGKTTVIRKLALDNARKRLDNPQQSALPLFLSLSTWKDEQTPLDFIRTFWPFNSDPEASLVQGDTFLYLDGLNEMGAAGSTKAQQLRTWLQSSEPPKKIIVTCRASDYTTMLSIDLQTIRTKEMNKDQIEQFAVNYLGNDKAPSFLSQLLFYKKSISDEHYPIGQNPYFLAALIYIYNNSPSSRLPQQPGLLFQRLTKALWMREQRNKSRGWVPLGEMEAAFSRLAFSMIYDDMPVEVPIDYALKHINSLDLLRAGESSNLIIKSNEIVRFYHQLMQEYFASLALSQRDSDVPELVKTEKWRNVIIAWSSWAEKPEELLRVLTFDETVKLKRADSNVPAELDNVLRSLVSGSDLGSTDPHDLMWIHKAVERAGKLATPYLIVALLLNNVRMRGHAAYLLGLTGDSNAVPILIARLSDTTEFDLLDYWGVTRICDAAALGLERLGTPEAQEALEQWKKTSSGKK